MILLRAGSTEAKEGYQSDKRRKPNPAQQRQQRSTGRSFEKITKGPDAADSAIFGFWNHHIFGSIDQESGGKKHSVSGYLAP